MREKQHWSKTVLFCAAAFFLLAPFLVCAGCVGGCTEAVQQGIQSGREAGEKREKERQEFNAKREREKKDK